MTVSTYLLKCKQNFHSNSGIILGSSHPKRAKGIPAAQVMKNARRVLSETGIKTDMKDWR
jgi:hypothetical protein